MSNHVTISFLSFYADATFSLKFTPTCEKYADLLVNLIKYKPLAIKRFMKTQRQMRNMWTGVTGPPVFDLGWCIGLIISWGTSVAYLKANSDGLWVFSCTTGLCTVGKKPFPDFFEIQTKHPKVGDSFKLEVTWYKERMFLCLGLEKVINNQQKSCSKTLCANTLS